MPSPPTGRSAAAPRGRRSRCGPAWRSGIPTLPTSTTSTPCSWMRPRPPRDSSTPTASWPRPSAGSAISAIVTWSSMTPRPAKRSRSGSPPRAGSAAGPCTWCSPPTRPRWRPIRARVSSPSAEMHALQLAGLRAEAPEIDARAGLVERLVATQTALRAHTPSRCFGAGDPGGALGSTCTLFLDEDVNGRRVATVEEVGTLPAERGRGLARAVVCAAVAHAGRWGAELIVVPADADDWPQVMYARLGFAPVGRQVALTRRLRDRRRGGRGPIPWQATCSLGEAWTPSPPPPPNRSPTAASPGPTRSGPTPPSCAGACRSSRASSWSARCGAFARAACASTSSCATRAARCRARCGARTSIAWA